MAIQKILQIGNEQLKMVSQPVDFSKDRPEIWISDLEDTLRSFQKEHSLGRAIAGPQIGCQKRIIVMESAHLKITMINPEITEKSDEMFEVWDSCFSADAAFFGRIQRHKSITVEYQNTRGILQTKKFTGDLSELFQHEIDHLDGILFTDRIVDNQIIMRSEWEKRRQ